ncbi:MAG: GntR family transcriptional regulator [Rhodocyclaceae bacterium]
MVSSLKPVDRPLALGDQVYRTLRGHLRDGLVQPGQRLTEVDLATRLGVSRTPVREALGRLASEGLIAVQGRSYAVPMMSDSDIDDIYELRTLLEPEALRQVALRARGPRRLAGIRQALQASRSAHEAGDKQAFMSANAQFRSAWLALVPNRRLVHAIDLYSDHVRYLRALTLEDPAVRELVLSGLTRILAALAAGDGQAAAAAMREHLSAAKRCYAAAARSARSGGAEAHAALS